MSETDDQNLDDLAKGTFVVTNSSQGTLFVTSEATRCCGLKVLRFGGHQCPQTCFQHENARKSFLLSGARMRTMSKPGWSKFVYHIAF